MIRNRATPAGRALGRELARLVDEAEPRARLVEPAIPTRCASCAFRAGPHVANGSEVTLADAMRCALEGERFDCHEPGRAGQPCSGWLLLQLDEPGRAHGVAATIPELPSPDQGAFAFGPIPSAQPAREVTP